MRFIARFTRVRVLSLASLILTASVCTASSGASSPARAATIFQTPVEYVTTYADDCVTPQTVFNLGDTVCVQAGDFRSALEPGYRRFQWSAPNGNVADRIDIRADPQREKFTIPSTGDFAQVGPWYANTVNVDANRQVRARFTVRDPRNPFADLGLTKWGPSSFIPGDRVVYRVHVTNNGPDFAEGLTIEDAVPNDMVFVTVKQASGPEVECSTPAPGGTGSTFCKGKGLASYESLELAFYYEVSREVKEGTSFLASAEAFSSLQELNKVDNFCTHEYVYEVQADGGTDVVPDP